MMDANTVHKESVRFSNRKRNSEASGINCLMRDDVVP